MTIRRNSTAFPRCVFLYGPPAAGKTTIGRHLAALTSYRLVINHLLVPLADAVFPRSNPGNEHHYFALMKTVRLATATAAVHAGVSVITTMAYSGRPDDPFLADLVATIEAGGGTIQFVELTAPDEVLFSRVGRQSRRRLAKLTDPAGLRTLLGTRDMRARVPYPDVLRVDTSTMPATTAAHTIAEWLSGPHTDGGVGYPLNSGGTEYAQP